MNKAGLPCQTNQSNQTYYLTLFFNKKKNILILIPVTTSSLMNYNSEKEKEKGGTETCPRFY